MEWNALTYAGHTVWNVHNEFVVGEGYKGGRKRRARSEWVIQRQTHDALVSDEEAESILRQLATSKHSEQRRTSADDLRRGVLKLRQRGIVVRRRQRQYRTKPAKGRGRYVSKELVENAVIGKVLDDMQSPSFVQQLTAEASVTPQRSHEIRRGTCVISLVI